MKNFQSRLNLFIDIGNMNMILTETLKKIKIKNQIAILYLIMVFYLAFLYLKIFFQQHLYQNYKFLLQILMQLKIFL